MKVYENYQYAGRNNDPITQQWLVNINMRYGYFILNVKIREDLGLDEPETRAMVAKSEDTGDWYVAFGCDLPPKESRKLRGIKNRGSKGAKLFSCLKAAIEIGMKVKAKTGVTFAVSRKPTLQDGIKWHRIMTATPIRVS